MEPSGYECETADESLLDRLRELAAILDPVPEGVVAGARAAFRSQLPPGAGSVRTGKCAAGGVHGLP